MPLLSKEFKNAAASFDNLAMSIITKDDFQNFLSENPVLHGVNC